MNKVMGGISCLKGLWAAVLKRAIDDYNGVIVNGDNPETTKAKARAWIFSASEKTGSLNWICESLDMDSIKLRVQILQNEKDGKILRQRDGR